MTQSQDRFYEQLVRAGAPGGGAGEELRRRVMAEAIAASQDGPEDEIYAAGLLEPPQPAVRLVPDVPTVPADGVPRGTSQIEIPGRRHKRRWAPMPTKLKWILRAGATAAAAAVLLVVLLRGDENRQGAFAQAIAQVKSANTIVCEMNSPEPVSIMGMQLTATSKLYISAEYGSRYEQYANGMLVSVMIVPPEGNAANLNVLAKQYLSMDMQKLADASRRKHNPDEFIRGIANLAGRSTRDLGTATVGGAQAYGYEIAGTQVDGGTTGDRSELWVDPQTSMPVRYVVEMPGFESGKTMTVVYEQFQLDVPLDPKLFDTSVPEGYTRVDVTMPNPDENSLINALRQYSNITGDYPGVLSMPRVVGGLMMAGIKGRKQPDNMEQVSLEIGVGVVFYAELQGKGLSPEYFGNKVKPGQQDAVLVRWKAEGGNWRVIFGDLRIDTVEGEMTPPSK